jgi:hypothetical protein
MKPRQQAILHTVSRWAHVYKNGNPGGGCHLCKVVMNSCRCCPYVEVFGVRCLAHFPDLSSLWDGQRFWTKEKLRRACELAAQYGLKRQAALIVRRILRG